MFVVALSIVILYIKEQNDFRPITNRKVITSIFSNNHHIIMLSSCNLKKKYKTRSLKMYTTTNITYECLWETIFNLHVIYPSPFLFVLKTDLIILVAKSITKKKRNKIRLLMIA